MSAPERLDGERRAEVLMDSAIRVFGIDVTGRARLRGIPRWALRGRVVGETYRYKAALDHSARGDELTATAYPTDIRHARDRLTTFSLSVHPLREDVAIFNDVKVGENPEHLEGVLAQNRIAVFLAEAQADVEAVSP